MSILSDKTLTDVVTLPDPATSQEVSADNELPASPENIHVNQTSSGVSIQWHYPKQAPVKIEYFQIYFREVVADDSDSERPDEAVRTSTEWLTSESIEANQNSYFIDETNFVENHSYEFQMVAFSVYSKSLPSQLIKLKYLPKLTRKLTSSCC